jgi:ribosome-associated protein
VKITPDVTIDESELELSAARSSGPGGQHVNKAETKVVLSFDLERSGSLSPEQKDRLRESLSHRLTKDGRLRLTSQRHRSRSVNEREVRERFAELIAQGLEEQPERRSTRVPRPERRRRLEEKRQRSRIKSRRAPPRRDDDDAP